MKTMCIGNTFWKFASTEIKDTVEMIDNFCLLIRDNRAYVFK